MTVKPQGTPVWADAMFADVEGAKKFYGAVLGWTFGEMPSDQGAYAQAYADGKAVAAVVPPMPGEEGTSRWCLYLASSDVAATAAEVQRHGGRVLLEPTQVDDLGVLCIASDPDGVVFGVWQAGVHEGFEATKEQPGAFCWAEVFTREPARADAFFPAVFGYTSQQMDDPNVDFRIYHVEGEPVLGRMKMTDDFPPEVPPYVNVYFSVSGCDEAVARATGLGAVLRYGPVDSPFGRYASLTDPQGADFSILDVTHLTGEEPELTDLP
ncbi:VOC family protein [Streptomyces sp. NPDC048057]|uniref:VOC family protein n=1 Tax=Streptomyces sp. NPDC048057 TaxID=3155628 RepID=UPI0033C275BB